MKSIEVQYQEEQAQFLQDLNNNFFQDILALAEERGLTIKASHLIALIYKLMHIMKVEREVCKEEGLDIQVTRIEFEITENKSAKFTIVPLRENGEPVRAERNPVVFFMAAGEDAKKTSHKYKEIFEAPDELPSEN